MKRVILRVTAVFALLLSVCSTALAVPAEPGVFKVLQKDGTTISIKVFGDEFFNYTTTTDGYLIAQRDGVYYHSDIAFDGKETISKVKANDPASRTSEEKAMLSTKSASAKIAMLSGVASMRRSARAAEPLKVVNASGVVRGLVLLVEYQDIKMTVSNPKTKFTNLLNQENYSDNGGTGSARDYFIDNSAGKFTPEFDIYGPYTLPQNRAYYGGNDDDGDDKAPKAMIIDAVKLAEAEGVDMTKYDNDNDGEVDMVFVFYAGYSESAGGPDECIWPHKWDVGSGVTAGGKRIGTYACSSELRSYQGATMAGIGTFSHEFGHVIGLADVYDTDGDANGDYIGVPKFDIMSDGNYNNSGCTPPHYMAYQRMQLGWLTPEEINYNGDFELEPLSQNKAYIIKTSTENEFYTLEYRNGTEAIGRNWDKYLYSGVTVNGLVVMHIDSSQNSVGGITAAQLWRNNDPNTYVDHPCARLVFTKTDFKDYGDLVTSTALPGTNNITALSPTTSPALVDWSRKGLKINIQDIRIEEGLVKFTNAVEKAATTASTNSIYLELSGTFDKCQVLWADAGTTNFTESPVLENISSYVIQNLTPEKSYDIIIRTANTGEELADYETKTISTTKISNSYPIINYSYNQKYNDRLMPFVADTDATEIVWKLNNNVFNPADAPLLDVRGIFTITCELTKGDEKELIIKSFKVAD